MRLAPALAALGLWCGAATADTVTARFTEPTDRYDHAVLGDALEWGALEITGADTVTIRLPESRVFEDLAPRVADADGNGTPDVIVVETDIAQGARLSVYALDGSLLGATPHIGQTNRWLAPIGAADLDGDGRVEIAYIDRPHLARTLRIWRLADGQMTELAALEGLTNHRIGENFISGGLRDCGDGPEMILASADWQRLVAVRYASGSLTARDLGPMSATFEAALACRL
jgi:hypothetical protein